MKHESDLILSPPYAPSLSFLTFFNCNNETLRLFYVIPILIGSYDGQG